MSKALSSSLLADIRSDVRTLAVCVDIMREDGRSYRLTNHDRSLVVDGNTYDHLIPFTLSAISTSSTFAVDNVEMTLRLDDSVFTQVDFNNGAFRHAEVTITLVNYTDTTRGRMILRKGWFGTVDTNKYGTARITIFGLMKILDLEVGRITQPSCDADFGDARCKIAVDYNQVYTALNTLYYVGQWVYHFDPTAATEVALLNGGFNDDGVLDTTDPITGWTRSANGGTHVALQGQPFTNPPAYEGGYALWGAEYPDGPPAEVHVYKEIDLTAAAADDCAGISASDIDAGRISVAFFAKLVQTAYLLDPVRLRMEILDDAHEVIDATDTGWVSMPEFEFWYERPRITELLAGARYAKLYIYFRIDDGVQINCGADDVHFYYWDHTVGTPWDDVVHKMERVAIVDNGSLQYPPNGSFEAASVTNSNVTAISGWVRPNTTADWWRVATIITAVPTHGARSLVGGDDGSGDQKTYELTNTHAVTAVGMTTAAIDTGTQIAQFRFDLTYLDNESYARCIVEFLAANGTTIISSTTVLDWTKITVGTPPLEYLLGEDFTVPALTRFIRIKVGARSSDDNDDGYARVSFDNFRYYVFTADRPKATDPIYGLGDEDTNFSTLAQTWTVDNQLLWRAYTQFVGYDTVSSVSDRKLFVGTDIAGSVGHYETALIKWISGANRGQRNLIRLWDPDTKEIKLYFKCLYDIAPGDRFQYVRACQKTFVGDCLTRFNNTVNFRGQPYLPGKVTE